MAVEAVIWDFGEEVNTPPKSQITASTATLRSCIKSERGGR